jgi:hypothetical protein
MDTLHFLLAPFVASLILTGIHAYLGVHVVTSYDVAPDANRVIALIPVETPES